MIPGPGYPVALLVKYISFNKLFTPISNLNIPFIYDVDMSIISYLGIIPTTPLKFPSIALDESENCSDRKLYCALKK